MRKGPATFLFAIVTFAVTAAIVQYGIRARRAAESGSSPDSTPTPPAFADHLSLATALSRAGSSKPVLAFATASWCPPCREFKSTTLQDERVTKWILENTVPAYVDVDHDGEAANSLSVTGIPAMILLRDGKAVAKFEGLVDADRFLAWGADALTRAATPAR